LAQESDLDLVSTVLTTAGGSASGALGAEIGHPAAGAGGELVHARPAGAGIGSHRQLRGHEYADQQACRPALTGRVVCGAAVMAIEAGALGTAEKPIGESGSRQQRPGVTSDIVIAWTPPCPLLPNASIASMPCAAWP
jgi:hypothetical protein